MFNIQIQEIEKNALKNIQTNLDKERQIRRGIEDEFNDSILKVNKSFHEVKNVFQLEIESMQKVTKSIRRSRRHFKQRQIAEFQKEQLDFEDIISSDDESSVSKNCNFPILVGEVSFTTPIEEWDEDISLQDDIEFKNYAYNHEAYKNAKNETERNVN